MEKLILWMCAAALICGVTSCTSCTSNKDNATAVEVSEFIPKAPDYDDATMWATSTVANPGSTVSALRRTSP